MPSRSHFSLRRLLMFLAFCVVFAALAVADSASGGILDHLVLACVAAIMVAGAVITSLRMWRARGDREEFWRIAHGSEVSWLPRRWRDWVFGENDPR